MKYTNTTSIWFGSLSYISNLLLKIIPCSKTLVDFSRWCDINANLTEDEASLISADYWNGSENDIINILREINHLSEEGHGYHGKYLLKRLSFLAKEGLNLAEGMDLPKYRKLSEDEVNSVIFSSKKFRKSRKTKRDTKGRFAPKKK